MDAKIRRNDPCPCGSGKKYKQCCLARDKAEQAERVAWERAAQNMRVALIGFAKEDFFTKDLALGLGLFWQDRYTADTVHLMSVDESLRFFDWFAHDYALQALDDPSQNGKRLIQIYREQVGGDLSDKEAAVLDRWIESAPASAFILQEAVVEQGNIVIRDLFIDRTLTVHDQSAATHGQIGQILLARPLPEHSRVRLSGATVVLPAEEEAELRSFVSSNWEAYAAESSSATIGEFLRNRAYLLTHYALAWADREHRPAVAVDDPNAPKPGQKAMQRLVKWQQDRVRVR